MSEPVYIDPSCIDIGDTIRVTFKVGDVTVTNVGTVADIDRYGITRRIISGEGVIIGTWRTTDSGRKRLRVERIRKHVAETMLPMLANIPEMVRDRAR